MCVSFTSSIDERQTDREGKKKKKKRRKKREKDYSTKELLKGDTETSLLPCIFIPIPVVGTVDKDPLCRLESRTVKGSSRQKWRTTLGCSFLLLLYKGFTLLSLHGRQPAWPSDKALLRLVSIRTSVRFHLGSPLFFKSCGLRTPPFVTLLLAINETLKWLSSLPVSVQKSFWWWWWW